MATDLPWASSDGSNLNYVRHNQPDRNIRRIVVPSSFADVVHHFGRPSLFFTFTTNPHWEEISPELLADEHGIRTQSWRNRPDLVSCVFKLKLNVMLQELRQNNMVTCVYTIEFQKRGLPHAHILLFLDYQSQFDTPGRISEVISAVADVELFKQYVNCRYVGSSENI